MTFQQCECCDGSGQVMTGSFTFEGNPIMDECYACGGSGRSEGPITLGDDDRESQGEDE
jgi:hypothetical protein